MAMGMSDPDVDSVSFRDSNGVDWVGFSHCEGCGGWHVPAHKSDDRKALALLLRAEHYCGGCFDQLVAKHIREE